MALVWYPLRGRSMWPLAPPFEAGVQRVAVAELRRGDIVAFLGARSGEVWLHRITEIAPDRLHTRGDTNGWADPVVPTAAVLGRLGAVRVGGIHLPVPTLGVQGALLRHLGLGWAAVAPLLRRSLRSARKC